MSRLYVRGASRRAGNEYSPLRLDTTVMLTELPAPFARTTTPSIAGSVSKLTFPERATAARPSGCADKAAVTLNTKTHTNKVDLNILRFLETGLHLVP